MRIPICLLIFFPESVREKHRHKYWDSRSDQEIIEAKKNADEFIRVMLLFGTEMTKKLANEESDRRKRYIEPQMEKRNIILN